MTNRENGNTRTGALREIQKLSRSKFEHIKKLPEFDSILYKFRQFNKQEKQTLSFTHISKTGNHMYNKNPSQKRVITCALLPSFKFKVLIVLRTTRSQCVIEES